MESAVSFEIWYTSRRLCDITFQKTAIFAVTNVRT